MVTTQQLDKPYKISVGILVVLIIISLFLGVFALITNPKIIKHFIIPDDINNNVVMEKDLTVDGTTEAEQKVSVGSTSSITSSLEVKTMNITDILEVGNQIVIPNDIKLFQGFNNYATISSTQDITLVLPAQPEGTTFMLPMTGITHSMFKTSGTQPNYFSFSQNQEALILADLPKGIYSLNLNLVVEPASSTVTSPIIFPLFVYYDNKGTPWSTPDDINRLITNKNIVQDLEQHNLDDEAAFLPSGTNVTLNGVAYVPVILNSTNNQKIGIQFLTFYTNLTSSAINWKITKLELEINKSQ